MIPGSKLKNLAVFSLLTMVLSLAPGFAAAANPGVLIVKINSEKKQPLLQNFGQSELLFNNIYRVRVSDYQSAIRDLQGQPWVDFVQTDSRVFASTVATDPLFSLDTADLSRQWYLSRIQIHQAWDRTTGSAQVVVAVIDTGVDGRHEDLNDSRIGRGYAYYCAKTTAENDCLTRVTSDLAPGANSDDNGHGTIVAGLIGAIPNNNRGISGINWQIKLMPVKVLDANGSGLSSDAAVGIKWAVDNGAKIISLSLGGVSLSGTSQVLQEAIAYAYRKGLLIVAAAGNDSALSGVNLNTTPVEPVCDDGGENMIVGVAAVDSADIKAGFSNYGSNCIDIAAPGAASFVDKNTKLGIISTYYDPARSSEQNLYAYVLGTSVAAPIVSGVAALMMATYPDLDAKAIRERLISSVDNIDGLNTAACKGQSCAGQIGKGRLNAFKAVNSGTSIFSPGSLLKSPEGLYYLIERGLRRPVSELVFKQRYANVTVNPADQFQIASFPEGVPMSPLDGTLIKEPANPTVYLMTSGERQPLSYLAFVSRALKFENVSIISQAELSSYPLGNPATVQNGVMIKSLDDPAVYLLDNGMRQLVSYFVFKQRSLSAGTIVDFTAEELALYPLSDGGHLYPPEDGTLIRGDQSATVYVIEQGTRFGLNLAAFQNRGFKFAEVKVLAQSEVDGYQLGGAIVE